MQPIPEQLLTRPFDRNEALTLGVTPRVLEGPRFVRVHPRVYRHTRLRMSFEDAVGAARLALPEHAHPTGITRIQLLGLDTGARAPLRFVLEGDLHLDLDGIFVHRTVLLPPTDEIGVTPAAAYLSFCHLARTMDALRVGDWLLHHGHMDLEELAALALGQEWRDGAREVAWVLPYLEGDSRSLRESELRALSVFAGLPRPEPNGEVRLGTAVVHGDLRFPAFHTVVEYEGVQHQADRGQYVSDIDRYATYRRHGVQYVLVTREKLRAPRAVVREIHACLVRGGYDGPAPDFGAMWDALFSRLARIVPGARRPATRPRRER